MGVLSSNAVTSSWATMRQQTSCQLRASMTLLTMLQFAALLLAVAGDQTIGRPTTSVEERLGVASDALTKALSCVSRATCAAALPAAIKSVNEAQVLISSNEMQAARGKVTAARHSNVGCLNVVRSSHNSPSRQGLYHLTLKADKALKDVEALLPVAIDSDEDRRSKPVPDSRALMVLEPPSFTPVKPAVDHYGSEGLQANSQQCFAHEVDGTVCQFSACAQGRNLVSCSIGFAKGVLGGYYGQWYVVTSDQDHPDNPPHGTLRYGLNLARNVQGGVWITFARDMTIELRAMLWVHSHTTVDGRGYNVTIHQHSVVMSGAKQVILENIQVNSVRGGDTVHIFAGCWKVWVDHVTSFGGDLGLVSVVQGSTDVTISNCKLSNHNFNMLLGASDNDDVDKKMRVTVYRNHFMDSMQRMPHCRWHGPVVSERVHFAGLGARLERWGWCHVTNNLYTNWGYYAVGARVNARVKTENNVFIPSRVNEVTPWHAGATPGSFDFSARIESKGDILMNGATFHQFLTATHDVRPPYPNGEYPPIIPAEKVRNLVSACAGAHIPKNLYLCKRAAGI